MLMLNNFHVRYTQQYVGNPDNIWGEGYSELFNNLDTSALEAKIILLENEMLSLTANGDEDESYNVTITQGCIQKFHDSTCK